MKEKWSEKEEALAKLQAHPINQGYDQIESKLIGQEQSKRLKYELEALIERLVELRYEPAVPYFKKLYAEISDYKIKEDLGEALLGIGTPEAHEFLQGFRLFPTRIFPGAPTLSNRFFFQTLSMPMNGSFLILQTRH